METLYFVLGMLSVVTLLADVGMVMTANKMRKLTQELDILKTLIGNENDELQLKFQMNQIESIRTYYVQSTIINYLTQQ